MGDPDPPCQERGCERDPIECRVIDLLTGEPALVEHYCPDHAERHGYCRMCGDFSAGDEGYEFLHPGRCRECEEEVRQEQREWDDPEDDDDWLDEEERDALLKI